MAAITGLFGQIDFGAVEVYKNAESILEVCVVGGAYVPYGKHTVTRVIIERSSP